MYELGIQANPPLVWPPFLRQVFGKNAETGESQLSDVPITMCAHGRSFQPGLGVDELYGRLVPRGIAREIAFEQSRGERRTRATAWI